MERTISPDVKPIVEAAGAIIEQPAKNKFLAAGKALTLIREGDYFKVRLLFSHELNATNAIRKIF